MSRAQQQTAKKDLDTADAALKAATAESERLQSAHQTAKQSADRARAEANAEQSGKGKGGKPSQGPIYRGLDAEARRLEADAAKIGADLAAARGRETGAREGYGRASAAAQTANDAAALQAKYDQYGQMIAYATGALAGVTAATVTAKSSEKARAATLQGAAKAIKGQVDKVHQSDKPGRKAREIVRANVATAGKLVNPNLLTRVRMRGGTLAGVAVAIGSAVVAEKYAADQREKGNEGVARSVDLFRQFDMAAGTLAGVKTLPTLFGSKLPNQADAAQINRGKIALENQSVEAKAVAKASRSAARTAAKVASVQSGTAFVKGVVSMAPKVPIAGPVSSIANTLPKVGGRGVAGLAIAVGAGALSMLGAAKQNNAEAASPQARQAYKTGKDHTAAEIRAYQRRTLR